MRAKLHVFFESRKKKTKKLISSAQFHTFAQEM